MNKTGLHKLLNLELNSNAPTFIIYSKKQSNRLQYVSKFIFEHVLKVNLVVTNNESEFKTSSFFKINYSEDLFLDTFQIIPQPILFETGISENKPKPILRNELVYFFENEITNEQTAFRYDIFAAVFYFISRYEEWQVFEPDVHQRFEANASSLFKNNMHLKPVVDYWILELKNELQTFFIPIKFPQTKFKVISTIDVDNLYAYKHKGVIRTFAAICKDILKWDIRNLDYRKNVLLKKLNDPFDIYSSISDFCLTQKIPLIYFFLFKSGTKYDRTLNPKSKAFLEVFARIKERGAFLGIHPSYFSSETKNSLTQELNYFTNQSQEKVHLSRQHYLKFNIKTTPDLLIENGIFADFTMGFASSAGFRAGTSFPFYYYDFTTETEKNLLFVPFCAMDGAYFVYDKVSPDIMLNELVQLANEVKKVNGLFISVFHERTFSNHLYPGFSRVYKELHQTINQL